MGAPLSALAALQSEAVHAAGKVVQACADGWYAVEGEAGTWQARRAASCLLAPAVGDTVLVSGPAAGPCYLIAVLEQAVPAGTLALAGDVVIAAPGSLRLQAGQDAAVQAGASLSLQGGELAVQAGHARVTVRELDYLGMAVRASAATVRVVGQACETVMDRITQVARQIFRLAEEHEQVRAGMLDMQAERSARLHARQTLVTGKDLVKVDADQIHMG
ncbi:DUF3540 domain-containing protein [Orrella sp. JC864]|uniref:DUF3540 domain-containing protein n=1 Tax=Orrella sp. JC864 TaxID=3120298 RepID=UPI0012BC7C2C